MKTSRRLSVVFSGVALLLLPAADWPQFRGSGGRGIADAAALTTWGANKNILWKTPLPGPGTSSPIVIGNRIYVTCYSGFGVPGQRGDMDKLLLHVVALDRTTGNIIWTRDLSPTLPEQATIREQHGFASGTPTADADRVYAAFGKSGVFALDLEGQQLWRTDVGSKLHGWGSSISPVLHDGLVIVNASAESESVYALDKQTGKEVWRARGIKDSWAMPLVADAGGGSSELVVPMIGKLLGLDPKTGKQLWTCDTDISWYMVPSPVAADGVVYTVGGRTGGGLAVRLGGRGDVTRTHRIWTIRKGSNVSSPLLHEGHLYWMHESQGIAYCADIKTGTIVYEQRVERADQVYAAPVLAGGKLYYLTRSGRLFVLPAKPVFEVLAVNELGQRGTYNASPTIAGGKVYLRTERDLYCIGEK